MYFVGTEVPGQWYQAKNGKIGFHCCHFEKLFSFLRNQNIRESGHYRTKTHTTYNKRIQIYTQKSIFVEMNHLWMAELGIYQAHLLVSQTWR